MSDREKLIELLVNNATCGETLGLDSCGTCSYRYDKNCYTLALADHLISNGVTMQKWIPVSERLPTENEYLAKAKDGSEYMVRLLVAYKTDIIEYTIGYYDGYKWLTDLPMHKIDDVIAWKPLESLPEPPKECE